MSVNPTLVAQMLNNDIAAAEALLDLLRQENELLKERKHPELETIVSAKSEHLNTLDAHARERSALLKSLGLANDSDGWVQYMHSQPPLVALTEQWTQLQELVHQCTLQNDKNGKLINRSQQTLNRLLDLVKGKGAGENLYNAKGATTNRAASGTMVKA
ncbi:flagellar protein FlgN [Gilvimarinus sp. SDUM040013]|uniref:Flagellar protein FlgN n=1 Tax=Gilvimarinus gilvus TaxID=3058038 RepID=A0ABU4RUA6_9GAMM|nr:flagellar protein FlgN [Gilvimarinus sp. SDUM040013]MDO3385090.1 flagellar protein FlgN [Gilvimarinus sp. SDUM040013]MDX6848465.1 flagellar protein FlgN [Gilvimarinus sp. SDUM040013]